MASPRQRWEVVGAIVIVSFLTILARAGISGAKLEMAHDLGISDLGFGLVFGAFALGYAVFMVPCGVLADRWGPRKSLTLSVFFWSLFTLCTGLATGISVLIFIRFLFGLAEAGVYPQAARALHNWTLTRERGLALGFLNMGSRLGAAFGSLAAPVCAAWRGWPTSFWYLGIVGVIWAAAWFWWFRDTPAIKLNPQKWNISHLGDKNALGILTRSPGERFFRRKTSTLIIYQYFASQFTFFICLSWLLPFLKSRFGISKQRSRTIFQYSVYIVVRSRCGLAAPPSTGFTRPAIGRLSRRLPAMRGFGLAAATLIPAPLMPLRDGSSPASRWPQLEWISPYAPVGHSAATWAARVWDSINDD